MRSCTAGHRVICRILSSTSQRRISKNVNKSTVWVFVKLSSPRSNSCTPLWCSCSTGKGWGRSRLTRQIVGYSENRKQTTRVVCFARQGLPRPLRLSDGIRSFHVYCFEDQASGGIYGFKVRSEQPSRTSSLADYAR